MIDTSLRSPRPVTGKEALRFLTAAAVNTALGLLAFSLPLMLGLPPYICLGFSILVAAVWNFYSYRFAFRAQKSPARYARFIFAFSLLYAANALLFLTLEPLVGHFVVRQLIAAILLAPFMFFLLKNWVYVGTRG